MDTSALGRSIVVLGLVVVGVGLLLWLGPRIPFFGRLPGDLKVDREGLTIVAPLGSMLAVSLLLTIAVNVIAYLRR